MTKEKVNIMGMELDKWTHKSCTAYIASSEGWSTVYRIKSNEEGSGHAQELLTALKGEYDNLKGTVALNPAMKHIYKKLNIPEYE